jgi:hypothetical protein
MLWESNENQLLFNTDLSLQSPVFTKTTLEREEQILDVTTLDASDHDVKNDSMETHLNKESLRSEP